jgi:hypothetical protein
MGSKKKVRAPAQQTIELEGISGRFYISGCQIAVRYFSTYASPDDQAQGGHYELLKQLVPMRERVKAARLKSLDSLLQRDLSDERIAQELIPYLQGKFSKVGFFPPVLAVLLPKGFIEGEGGGAPQYPRAVANGPLISTYGDYWTIEHYPQDDKGVKPSRLGNCSINPNRTNIVVLDGQHRSNAFRYVSGCFEPEEVYKPFYMGAKRSDGYLSDLPVTLIWFEAETAAVEVKPTDVSRELFVAVNNSAKRVSDARTVLLDDVSVVALGVNTYYRFLARDRGFDPGAQNLLTACFDLDSELAASRYPQMALTTPVTLKHAFEYAFLGTARYDELLERATRHEQNNQDRFKRLFGSVKYVQAGAPTRINEEHRPAFRKVFEANYLPVLDLLFEAPIMVREHHAACRKLVEWLKDNPAVLLGAWWDKAFIGGEGLYSAFQLSSLDGVRDVKKALAELNEKFVEIRTTLLLGKNAAESKRTRLDQVFQSFNTIAFQAGFLMAIDLLTRKFFSSNLKKSVPEIGGLVRSLSVEKWMVFFGEFREMYIPGTDPASWPKYTKMIVRMLGDDYVEAFGDTPESRLPDYVMAEDAIKKYIKDSVSAGDVLEGREVTAFAKKKADEVAAVMKAFGLKPPLDLAEATSKVGKAYLAELQED